MTAPALAPAYEAMADAVAVQEVLGFNARYLAALPYSWRLLCARQGDGRQFVITNNRDAHREAHSAKLTPFHAGELKAMTLAAEHDRAWPADLDEWCRRKARPGGFELKLRPALGGMAVRPMELGWTLGDVLERLGASLNAVDVCGDSQ